MSNDPKAPQQPGTQQQRSDVDTKKTETKESGPGGSEVKTTQTEEHKTDRDSRRE